MDWVILTSQEFYLTIIYWFLFGMCIPSILIYVYNYIKERKLI